MGCTTLTEIGAQSEWPTSTPDIDLTEQRGSRNRDAGFRPVGRDPRYNPIRLIKPPLPQLFAFLGNAAAMQYTHVDASIQDCRHRVAAHEYRRRQDAPWSVASKTDNRIVGWGGLYNDPFEPGWGVEVGFFFRPDVWCRGYATELVAACIDLADRVLKTPGSQGIRPSREYRLATRAGKSRFRGSRLFLQMAKAWTNISLAESDVAKQSKFQVGRRRVATYS